MTQNGEPQSREPLHKRLRQLRMVEWEAIAGIIAAVAVIIMKLLHLIDTEVLITIAVVLIALLFLRDLRREAPTERAYQRLEQNHELLQRLSANSVPPEALLIGPHRLREVSRSFLAHTSGEMLWFHVCLEMFRPQSLFDDLLLPAIENPKVTAIQFVLDPKQQELWETQVLSKVAQCAGAAKVRTPNWSPIDASVSVIVGSNPKTGRPEALLSFWGEPFMAHSIGRDVPRYIFHVQSHSDLAGRLVELIRNHRLL
jgi:hypothetical protein